MRLEIKTADELRDPDLEARWAERREGPQAEVLRYLSSRGEACTRAGAGLAEDLGRGPGHTPERRLTASGSTNGLHGRVRLRRLHV